MATVLAAVAAAVAASGGVGVRGAVRSDEFGNVGQGMYGSFTSKIGSCNTVALQHVANGFALWAVQWAEAASREFTWGRAAEPQCAMAWWGGLLSLWSPWDDTLDVASSGQLAQSLEQILLGPTVTNMERAHGHAVLAMFAAGVADGDRVALFADHMENVTDTFPEDAAAVTLYAAALQAQSVPQVRGVARRNYDQAATGRKLALQVLSGSPGLPAAATVLSMGSATVPLAQTALSRVELAVQAAPDAPGMWRQLGELVSATRWLPSQSLCTHMRVLLIAAMQNARLGHWHNASNAFKEAVAASSRYATKSGSTELDWYSMMRSISTMIQEGRFSEATTQLQRLNAGVSTEKGAFALSAYYAIAKAEYDVLSGGDAQLDDTEPTLLKCAECTTAVNAMRFRGHASEICLGSCCYRGDSPAI